MATIRRKPDILEATFLRACDGDTFVALIHLPLGIHVEKRIRIACIESYELNGPDAARAKEAGDWLHNWLRGHEICLHPAQGGPDRYGRIRAHVFFGDQNVAHVLCKAGQAWPVPPSHTHANPAPRPTTAQAAQHPHHE